MRPLIALSFLILTLVSGLAVDKPNFLLIIADDLNWRDLGCLGNPDVKTPNIDKLAGQSLRLNGMFSPAPTCSPLRHALYTGLDGVRSGAYPNHTMVDEGTKSIFTYLKSMGYRVALQAKSHVSPPSSFPFEYLGPDADDAKALSRFINRDKTQPWFAVFASNDPHTPWTRGPTNLYDPAKLTLPVWMHENLETRRSLAAYYAEVTKLDEQVGACLKAVEDSGQANNTLVMFVSEQGSSFPYGGKWSLYDTGIRTSTYVRWPGRTKPGTVNDALMEYLDVPPTFIEAAGGDPEKIDTGCADANGNRGFDGRSFLKVLLGQTNHLRDCVFAQHTTVGIIGFKEPYPIRSARDTRYKLIRNLAPQNRFWIAGIHGTDIFASWEREAEHNPELAARVKWLSHRPAEELYDLQSDPFELKNLANDPKLAPVKARLGRELDAWMAQQGDKGMETELKAKSRQPGAIKAAANAKAGKGKKKSAE